MNTIINPAPSLPQWPLMMSNKDCSLIVLFSGYRTGMVIACTDDNNYFVGKYCNTWAMNEFIPFNGSITIKAVNGK